LCPTLTFVASANAILYLGAQPVFIDSEPVRWNLDPQVVADELAAAAARGRRYAAVVAVDLYGRCCDYEALEAVCAAFGVPLVEDAAEALGSHHHGRPAGSFGTAGVFSFNGNKIITTSGGGMLVTDDASLAWRARHLATQARERAPHYEHAEVGFNYRMSNLLAAIGRAQLLSLDEKVARRRALARGYVSALAELPGVKVIDPPADNGWNGWLTCITIDPGEAGTDREQVRLSLRKRGIEARPVWKPMHLQPLFAEARVVGGNVAARLFGQGLCLPSGSSLTAAEQEEICAAIVAAVRHG
jgi:dTDP-4-amino-4,6-dideoxygalactose transaminase